MGVTYPSLDQTHREMIALQLKECTHVKKIAFVTVNELQALLKAVIALQCPWDDITPIARTFPSLFPKMSTDVLIATLVTLCKLEASWNTMPKPAHVVLPSLLSALTPAQLQQVMAILPLIRCALRTDKDAFQATLPIQQELNRLILQQFASLTAAERQKMDTPASEVFFDWLAVADPEAVIETLGGSPRFTSRPVDPFTNALAKQLVNTLPSALLAWKPDGVFTATVASVKHGVFVAVADDNEALFHVAIVSDEDFLPGSTVLKLSARLKHFLSTPAGAVVKHIREADLNEEGLKKFTKMLSQVEFAPGELPVPRAQPPAKSTAAAVAPSTKGSEADTRPTPSSSASQSITSSAGQAHKTDKKSTASASRGAKQKIPKAPATDPIPETKAKSVRGPIVSSTLAAYMEKPAVAAAPPKEVPWWMSRQIPRITQLPPAELSPGSVSSFLAPGVRRANGWWSGGGDES